jgi:tetratricopeptide (TPR) repeat protein
MAKKGSRNPGVLRCLSIRQPFAWLVCIGAKTIENRTWQTDFRGTIAIHASTSQTNVRALEQELPNGTIKPDDFRFGAIIGLADIEEIKPYGREHESDMFASGPYCWRMSHGRLLKKPIPMSGKLNLFSLDEATSEKVWNSEFIELDPKKDERIQRILGAFHSSPDPGRWYRYALSELSETLEPSELLSMANRLVELEPDDLDSYNYRMMIARQLDRLSLVKSDTDRILDLVQSIFGKGEDDAALRQARDLWNEDDTEADEDVDDNDESEFETGGEFDSDDDPESRLDNLKSQLMTLVSNYLEFGDVAKSKKLADRLVNLDPEDVESYILRGKVWRDGQKKYQEATDDFQKAVALSGNRELFDSRETQDEWRCAAILEMAKTFRLSGDVDAADSMIKKVLGESTVGAEELLEAALIAEAKNDRPTAMRLAKELLAEDEESVEAVELLTRLGRRS